MFVTRFIAKQHKQLGKALGKALSKALVRHWKGTGKAMDNTSMASFEPPSGPYKTSMIWSLKPRTGGNL